MRSEMKREVARLSGLLAKAGYPMARQPGASETQLVEIESEMGIRYPADLRALYLFSDGSGIAPWFVYRQANIFCDVFDFCSLEQVRLVKREIFPEPYIPFAACNGWMSVLALDRREPDRGVWLDGPETQGFHRIAEDFLSFFVRSNHFIEQLGPGASEWLEPLPF